MTGLTQITAIFLLFQLFGTIVGLIQTEHISVKHFSEKDFDQSAIGQFEAHFRIFLSEANLFEMDPFLHSHIAPPS